MRNILMLPMLLVTACGIATSDKAPHPVVIFCEELEPVADPFANGTAQMANDELVILGANFFSQYDAGCDTANDL